MRTILIAVALCVESTCVVPSVWAENGSVNVSIADPAITKPLPAAAEAAYFTLPEGFRIDLVAAEPLVINPVCIALDDKGRLYVAESHTYRYGPGGSPVKPATNPIVRLDPLSDGTGFTRTLVAEGFDDPVMGMAIRDGRLWAAANDKLFRLDLADDGPATNKTTLLVDKNKTWNPFGMFVLEWGQDGSLLMSVGNHDADIGPEGQPKGEGITGRGGSGIVIRMNPDGTRLERLVHGLRVPYAFEIDPFGQHWQLSNGEGNPNRFVRVIDGVDYLCYSRPRVFPEWLAGKHPLAPPCFELPRGATTQLLRYYGANFPASYQGSLFIDNWGAHGFGGANRTIFRYVPDDRNAIVTREEFLTCRDPHFRCSHVLVAPDGSLYLTDWYGRDDESDKTGRIWRVSYSGSERTANANVGPEAEALAAARALWKLVRNDSPEATAGLVAGSRHPDWRVRRLALLLLHRSTAKELPAVAQSLVTDPDLAVRVTAARFLGDPVAKRGSLMAILHDGAAADDHLRYEAAWHLADVADRATFESLLGSSDERLRHAGLIAIDVAGYENRASAPVALAMLGEAIRKPGFPDRKLIYELAGLHDAAPVVDALRAIVADESVDPAVTAQAILLLRSKSNTESIDQRAVDRFVAAVKSGKAPARTTTEKMTVLDLIEPEGPTPFMIGQLEYAAQHGDKALRDKGHALARKFGPTAAALAPLLWKRLGDAKDKDLERKSELLTTVLAIEDKPDVAAWTALLNTAQEPVLTEVVRSWRALGTRPEFAAILVERAAALIAAKESWKPEIAAVVAGWPSSSAQMQSLGLDATAPAVDVYKTAAAKGRQSRDNQLLGRRVFERTGCTKCHTALGQNTERAPSLAGIGKAQKPEYLMESILDPSVIIKTGYETETILTTDGKVHVGLVKEVGDSLRVITPDGEAIIPKADIDERTVQKKSLMPDGQHLTMSPAEFADLIAYLRSL